MKLIKIIIPIIIILAIYYGVKLYNRYSVIEVEIEKVKAERGDIDVEFNETGYIEPGDSRNIYSPVSGTISEVYINEGDNVKEGDKLVKIQPGMSASDKFIPVEVKSPISGVVMPCAKEDRYSDDKSAIKSPGERVTGQTDYNPTCIMKVANMEKMSVIVNVNEIDILKIKKGMKVDITVDAINKKVKGKVNSISFSSSYSKTYPVKIDIIEKIEALPNMTARVKALIEKKKNVIKIPISALFSENYADYVYIYNPATKKARKANVTIGIRSDMYIEILNGVKEGDELYTDKPLNIIEEENDKIRKNNKKLSI